MRDPETTEYRREKLVLKMWAVYKPVYKLPRNKLTFTQCLEVHYFTRTLSKWFTGQDVL